MFECFFNFLNKNKILYDHQFEIQVNFNGNHRHIFQTDRLNQTEKILMLFECFFNFLNKNKILYDHQFEFQVNFNGNLRHIFQTDTLNQTEKILMLSIPRF